MAPVVEEGVRRTGWAEGEQWVIQSPGGQGRGRGACQGQRGESGAHALYPHDTLGPRVSHPPWASGSPLQVATGNKNTETPLTVQVYFWEVPLRGKKNHLIIYLQTGMLTTMSCRILTNGKAH